MKGMWPAEGSLSNQVLDLMIKNKINWTATDQKILEISDHPKKKLEHYFPRKYESNSGSITIFFRDTNLSDKIGFKYSGMNPTDAVNDFFDQLHSIRDSIIQEYGEFALDHACVSIILDGENCWEFFPELGKDFREALFQRLNEDPYFRTQKLSDASTKDKFFLPLDKIKAGSWINGNFKIWIGEQIHLDAWKLLSKIRKKLENSIESKNISQKSYQNSLKWIYKAESSDWFWWYYSGHQAPNKYDFDKIFLNNLKSAMNCLKLEIDPKDMESLWKNYSDIASNLEGSAMHRVSFE
jgi:alpha-amylase/alpha-mannosidase (GH57 family)